MTTVQRRFLAILLGLAGAVVLATSAAYACGVLATLQLDTEQAAAGDTVDARGTGFRDGEPNVVSDVVITLDSRDGVELWRGRANADRTVDASFAIPDVEPGYHIVFATQYFADGSPVAGSPARATIEIVAAAATAQGTDDGEQRQASSSSESGAATSGSSDDGAASAPASTTTAPTAPSTTVAATTTGEAPSPAAPAAVEAVAPAPATRTGIAPLDPWQRQLLVAGASPVVPADRVTAVPPRDRPVARTAPATAPAAPVASTRPRGLDPATLAGLFATAALLVILRRVAPAMSGPPRLRAPG